MGLGKVLSKSLESSPLMIDVISKEKKRHKDVNM